LKELEELVASIADKPKFLYLPTYNNLLFQYCSLGQSDKIQSTLTGLNFPQMIETAEFASTRRLVRKIYTLFYYIFSFLILIIFFIIIIFFFFFLF